MKRSAKKLLTALLCIAMLAGSGFFAFWKLKLAADAPYNPERPEKLMETLLSTNTKEQWKQQLFALWDEPVSEYEEREPVFSAIFDSLTEGDFAFRPSGEKNCFVLSSGDNDLAVLRYVYENESWRVQETKCLFTAQSESIRILVPEEVVPTVNGIALSEAAVSNQALNYEDMNDYESRFEHKLLRREYSVSGLYQLPEVEAEGARLIAVEGNCWSYEPPDARSHSLSISAPSDATVCVDGVTLDAALITARESVPVDVELSESLRSSLPAYSRYELSGLYSAAPAVTVTAADGTVLSGNRDENGLLSYTPSTQEAPEPEIEKLAEDYITNLCRYGAGLVGSDTMWMYTVQGCELQSFLTRAQGSLFWIRGTGLTLQEPVAENFIPLSENACVCTARVTGSVKNYYMTYEAEFACQLLCQRTENGWKVADMAYE